MTPRRPGEECRPSSLSNLGVVSDRWLAEIDVRTVAELRAMGSIEAWRRLRFALGPRVSLNMLYALDGALSGHDWRHLPPGRKDELLRTVAGEMRSRPPIR